MSQQALKKSAAQAAFKYVSENFMKGDEVIGIGTGSTSNYFIDLLKGSRNRFVSSSKESTTRLKSLGLIVEDLNSVLTVDVYIDGADEINEHGYMLKGGGGALTSEKIIASMAKKFLVIVDASKTVEVLGKFPMVVEVIPMARSFVARQLKAMGGDPEYRVGFVTDHGNVILDVYNLDLTNALGVEQAVNHIPGVVCNGLFAARPADLVFVASAHGVFVRNPAA